MRYRERSRVGGTGAFGARLARPRVPSLGLPVTAVVLGGGPGLIIGGTLPSVTVVGVRPCLRCSCWSMPRYVGGTAPSRLMLAALRGPRGSWKGCRRHRLRVRLRIPAPGANSAGCCSRPRWTSFARCSQVIWAAAPGLASMPSGTGSCPAARPGCMIPAGLRTW